MINHELIPAEDTVLDYSNPFAFTEKARSTFVCTCGTYNIDTDEPTIAMQELALHREAAWIDEERENRILFVETPRHSAVMQKPYVGDIVVWYGHRWMVVSRWFDVGKGKEMATIEGFHGGKLDLELNPENNHVLGWVHSL